MFWEVGSVIGGDPALLNVVVEDPKPVTWIVYVPGSALDVAEAETVEGSDTVADIELWAVPIA